MISFCKYLINLQHFRKYVVQPFDNLPVFVWWQDERNQILTTYLWIRQVWTDAYLKWKKEDYDGLDTIRIPSSYVWRPDIVLYNR